MVQSLSFLEGYEQTKFPWIITDGNLYTGSEHIPQTVVFGKKKIGLEDKGQITQLEKQHIASRKHLLHGTIIKKVPSRFEDKIIAAYRRQISSEEEGPRREWLQQASKYSSGRCILEQTLQRLHRADTYIGLKGTMYALKETPGGSFRFKNKHYTTKNIGSTTKVCAQHELAVRKHLRNNSSSFSVESQELSSLDVALRGTACTARLTLEPFAMYTPYGMYSFGRCIAEYAFTVKKQNMSFTDIPKIVQPTPYAHPFVWFDSNSICFNGGERWEKEKVPVGSVIPRRDAENKIAFVAAETARMLRGSYTKDSTPANSLQDMPSQKITERQSIQKQLVVYGTK